MQPGAIKMKKLITILLLLYSATVLAGLKISIWTNPKTYLKKFPLNETTQTQIYEALGAPESTLKMGGLDVWIYKYGEGYGLRKYSFEIKDGIVVEVRYNDQGPYNGKTASGMQKDK